MGYFKVFEEGYRRKVRQNYRDIKNVEGASKRSILLTPRHNKDLHSGTFSKGLKDTFNHIGYQVQNLFNFKSNRKPLAAAPIHPAVAKILNTKPLGKSSWFKLGQVHTVLTGGKTNVYDNSKYRPIELSIGRQLKLAKDKTSTIYKQAKRLNVIRTVLNKITSGFEKAIAILPSGLRNVYANFKSNARKEFIKSYRDTIRKEIANNTNLRYNTVLKESSDIVKNMNIVGQKGSSVPMGQKLKTFLVNKHTNAHMFATRGGASQSAHIKALVSSLKIRGNAIGKASLIIAGTALAGYGIKQLLTSGNKLKAKVTKSLVGRLEHNKRISEGLKKSTKIKHNRK